MWCHVRLINLTNSHPERINKQDKKIAPNLNYSNIVFPLDINDYISKNSYNQKLNLILITKKDKSHYVFIKDFNRLMFSKTKQKDKKHFCMSCLQNFSTKEIFISQKTMFINGCQAVNYESGIIKFTNYNK